MHRHEYTEPHFEQKMAVALKNAPHQKGWSRFKVKYCFCRIVYLIDWLNESFTAHQHQKGHTVPKLVSPLDDDDITESTRKKCYGSTVWELHCLRTALCESISYQAKSEQNVRQDQIPRVRQPNGVDI